MKHEEKVALQEECTDNRITGVCSFPQRKPNNALQQSQVRLLLGFVQAPAGVSRAGHLQAESSGLSFSIYFLNLAQSEKKKPQISMKLLLSHQ